VDILISRILIVGKKEEGLVLSIRGRKCVDIYTRKSPGYESPLKTTLTAIKVIDSTGRISVGE
jgi:hypothetical protein